MDIIASLDFDTIVILCSMSFVISLLAGLGFSVASRILRPHVKYSLYGRVDQTYDNKDKPNARRSSTKK